MAWTDKNGNRRYNLKEKVDYHKELANSGENKDGVPLSLYSRVHHAIIAERQTRQLNKNMKSNQRLKNRLNIK